MDTQLVDRLISFKLRSGLYATDLIAHVGILPEAVNDYKTLSSIGQDDLNDTQRQILEWATLTIAQCNRVILDHAEKYPYLFDFSDMDER